MYSTTDRRNVYDSVTDQIITLLDHGTVPWRRPWDPRSDGIRPLNVRGNLYRGANRAILPAMGFGSPIWMTFKQANERGGHVRKGEHGTMVTFWKFDRGEEPVQLDGEEQSTSGMRAILRAYTVFNLEQTDDVRLPAGMLERFAQIANRKHAAIAEADAVVEGYLRPPSIHHAGPQAYYRPSADSVTMPVPDSFHSPEAYYSTLFHELGHSTGHESRLARKGITDLAMFGGHDYSCEELVAELTASFLAAECGIGTAVLGNSAAYIQSWMAALKHDRRLFVTAAGQAQKAADHILRREGQ